MTSSYAHNRFLSETSDNDVTDAGNVNLDSTLTTSQDQFTLNQEMITKKYVDDTCTRIVQPIIASVNYNSNEIDIQNRQILQILRQMQIQSQLFRT